MSTNNHRKDYTDPMSWVLQMGEPLTRFKAYQKLINLGDRALPALRKGLKSEIYQIRKWSAMCMDQVSDEASLNDLLPLLEDSNSQVRLWAVHSLSCEHCKDNVRCQTDLVPLLMKRAKSDESLRVRRMAVIMLTTEFDDERVLPLLQELLQKEKDRKLRLHAARGLNHLIQKGFGSVIKY